MIGTYFSVSTVFALLFIHLALCVPDLHSFPIGNFMSASDGYKTYSRSLFPKTFVPGQRQPSPSTYSKGSKTTSTFKGVCPTYCITHTQYICPTYYITEVQEILS